MRMIRIQKAFPRERFWVEAAKSQNWPGSAVSRWEAKRMDGGVAVEGLFQLE